MVELAQAAESSSGSTAPLVFIYLIFLVVVIAAMWRIFTKAGEEGWKSIIPIYNIVVLLKIIGRPTWWLILMLIPLVNIVIGIIVAIDLAKSFGKGGGFAAGLILLGPIFYAILAFGSARYVGPAAAQGAPTYA